MTLWTRAPGWGVVDRPEQGDHGGTVYAAPLADGAISVLEGAAAAVCRAALVGADLEGVARAVAGDLGVGLDDVDGEVLTDVLDELAALGVVVRAG